MWPVFRCSRDVRKSCAGRTQVSGAPSQGPPHACASRVSVAHSVRDVFAFPTALANVAVSPLSVGSFASLATEAVLCSCPHRQTSRCFLLPAGGSFVIAKCSSLSLGKSTPCDTNRATGESLGSMFSQCPSFSIFPFSVFLYPYVLGLSLVSRP